MTLPQLVEWPRFHPQAKRLTSGTVNKLLGGVQAIATWAAKNGLIRDDARWSDPFAEMKLPESDELGGGPFEPDELRTLFSSPVFTAGQRPVEDTIVGRIYWEMVIGKTKWRWVLQQNREVGPGRPNPPPNQGWPTRSRRRRQRSRSVMRR